MRSRSSRETSHGSRSSLAALASRASRRRRSPSPAADARRLSRPRRGALLRRRRRASPFPAGVARPGRRRRPRLARSPPPRPPALPAARIVDPPSISIAKLPTENPFGAPLDVPAALPPKLAFTDAALDDRVLRLGARGSDRQGPSRSGATGTRSRRSPPRACGRSSAGRSPPRDGRARPSRRGAPIASSSPSRSTRRRSLQIDAHARDAGDSAARAVRVAARRPSGWRAAGRARRPKAPSRSSRSTRRRSRRRRRGPPTPSRARSRPGAGSRSTRTAASSARFRSRSPIRCFSPISGAP